jgi:hypothetical protein
VDLQATVIPPCSEEKKNKLVKRSNNSYDIPLLLTITSFFACAGSSASICIKLISVRSFSFCF